MTRRSIPFGLTISALLLAIIIQPLVRPQTVDAVTASDWQAGYIMDDARFTDSSAMSAAQIQNWLNTRLANCDPNGTRTSELSGGTDYNNDGKVTRAEYGKTYGNPAPFTCLNNYYEVPKTSPGSSIPASNYGKSTIPSGAKSAAQLIYDAGKAYNISPKVLLVKLGTESAGPLTSDTWPFKSQYTYAMGAHCPDSGPGGSANCDVNYSGFSLQMREAAKLLRWYLDNMNESWWTYKKPYSSNYILWNVEPSGCGGKNVFIQSKATAALYTYTPYQPNSAALSNMYGTGNSCSAYGNRNFWRVYNDWFGPTTSAITSYLSTCSGEKYLIEAGFSGKRHVSDEIAAQWGLSADSFAYTDYGCSMPTYSVELSNLVRSRNTGKVYFIYNGSAYNVKNQSVADSWGLGSIDTLPHVEGSTLHAYTAKIDTVGLTNIATSDNLSVSTYYLLVGGNRYSMAGTSGGNIDVLRLTSGDTMIERNTLPAGILQLLPSSGTIDYYFTVGDEMYVFDFGKIRKITSNATRNVIGNETSPPIALDDSVLSLYGDKWTLGDTFYRDGHYYLMNTNRSMVKTDDVSVLKNISPTPPEAITRLLTLRLTGNSASIATKNLLVGNIRLISCEGNSYLIERYIRLKRSVEPYAVSNWGFDDNHFFTGDRGCSYPSLSISLDETIRSRNTGKVYQVVDGEARYVSTQTIADQYGLVNYAQEVYPQFGGASIKDNLTVVR